MADMWIDVDTAVTVPVNLMPLIDDTDFKTRETGIVYNQAGMDLVWNFQTPGGVTTQTAVTPTTAGDYDWTHSGDAMYKIEMTASGGASINNDTEGFGWFTGICTGVLAWRGPTIGFRAAGLNDKMIESAYDANRGLGGTALPAAAAEAAGGLYTRGTGAGQINQDANGRVDANLVAISEDTTAANNLELAFDGTGYGFTGCTMPTVTTLTALDASQTELASVPSTTSSMRLQNQWVYEYFRNKKTTTATTETLFKEDASTTLGTATVSEAGGTFTKGEMG